MLPDIQQSFFLTLMRSFLIPLRTSDSTKENRVARLACCDGFIRKRCLMRIYSTASDQRVLQMKSMSITHCNGLQHFYCRFCYFWSDSVSWQYRYCFFHFKFFLFRFIRLNYGCFCFLPLFYHLEVNCI